MIHIEVDTQAEIVRIGQRLERLAFQAPDILRLSINAAARKVRKQITKDAAGTYTIDESILKDRSKGAPKVQTAKPGNIEAVIRSKGPVNDLIDFLVRPGERRRKGQGAEIRRHETAGTRRRKSLYRKVPERPYRRFATADPANLHRGRRGGPYQKIRIPKRGPMAGHDQDQETAGAVCTKYAGKRGNPRKNQDHALHGPGPGDRKTDQ